MEDMKDTIVNAMENNGFEVEDVVDLYPAETGGLTFVKGAAIGVAVIAATGAVVLIVKKHKAKKGKNAGKSKNKISIKEMFQMKKDCGRDSDQETEEVTEEE